MNGPVPLFGDLSGLRPNRKLRFDDYGMDPQEMALGGDPVDYFAGDRARRAAERDNTLRIDPTRVNQANAFADATDEIVRQYGLAEQAPQPKQSLGQRLLSSLPDAIGYGLAGESGAYDTGLNGFLGALGRGYVGTRERRKQEEAQQQAANTDRERFAAKMKADLLGTTIQQRRLDLEATPEWQRQGYPDFETWRMDATRPKTGNTASSYDLRMGPDGEWTYIPKPNAAGLAPLRTGVIAPPPAPALVPTSDGYATVTRPRDGTATVTPITNPNTGTQLQGQVPEATNKAVQQNNALIAQIDRAIALLEKHPQATGFDKKVIRALPLAGPELLAGLDAENDETRAALNEINVQAVHEMFGGALTPTEVKRTDFAPAIGYGKNANIRRLKQLRAKAVSGNQTIQQQHSAAKAVNTGGGSASADDSLIDQIIADHPDWTDEQIADEYDRQTAGD